MAGVHHFLVDPLQYLRREQPQVVLEGLQLIAVIVRPIAMAQHLPYGRMLVGQLLNAVIIGVQA